MRSINIKPCIQECFGALPPSYIKDTVYYNTFRNSVVIETIYHVTLFNHDLFPGINNISGYSIVIIPYHKIECSFIGFKITVVEAYTYCSQSILHEGYIFVSYHSVPGTESVYPVSPFR